MASTRNRTLVLTLLGGCLVAAVGARAAAPSPEEGVAAAEKEWVTAVVHRDKPALQRLMADDIVYIHGDGNIQNKDAFIQEAMVPDHYTAIEFENSTVQALSGAVITAHKTLIRSKSHPEGEPLLVSFVWARRTGGWKLVHRQATDLRHHK
jgi:ketosteroid isomerase-like protein